MSKLVGRSMKQEEVETVVALWRRCGLLRTYNEPQHDIESARENPTSDMLVGCLDERTVACAMVGFDGHRGYVYYVAVDPDHHDRGFGRDMMSIAEEWLKRHGVWKINLMVRESNELVRGFYEKIGYESQPRVLYTKWLEEPEHYPED